jgi:hypothetical protein
MPLVGQAILPAAAFQAALLGHAPFLTLGGRRLQVYCRTFLSVSQEFIAHAFCLRVDESLRLNAQVTDKKASLGPGMTLGY